MTLFTDSRRGDRTAMQYSLDFYKAIKKSPKNYKEILARLKSKYRRDKLGLAYLSDFETALDKCDVGNIKLMDTFEEAIAFFIDILKKSLGQKPNPFKEER